MYNVSSNYLYFLQNQIIHYPKILNDVEKKIFLQRVEIENLLEMKKESYEERDLTLVSTCHLYLIQFCCQSKNMSQ